MKTPVLTAQNLTMPPVKTTYKKKAGEMKRRMNTNQKFKELEQLVRNQWDGKLKQEIVLRKAFDMVTKLKKSASNPHYCGFSKGFNQVRNIVIPFLIYLKMDKNKTENYIEQLEKIHPEYPNPSSTSETVPKEEIIDVFGFDDVEEVPSESQDTSALSETTPAEGIVENTETEKERKKKRLHMEREQVRREKLTEAYKNLNNFIVENNLWNGNGKPEKIETVSVTIDFIRASQVKQWVDQQEKLLFMAGQENGRLMAKTLFSDFFKHDGLLQTHLSDLEHYQSSTQSTSIDWIHRFHSVADCFSSLSDVTSSTTSPPPAPSLPLLVDTINPAVQDDQENVPPVDKPKFFRPFDV